MTHFGHLAHLLSFVITFLQYITIHFLQYITIHLKKTNTKALNNALQMKVLCEYSWYYKEWGDQNCLPKFNVSLTCLPDLIILVTTV